MDLNRWTKVFDTLLPRSRAWNLVYDRVLRRFFHGLAILPQLVHNHIGSVLLEAFPQTTSYLNDWSFTLGEWNELDADELEYDWADTGGQSPGYVEDLLHDKGFTQLYLHEWWVPGSSPLEHRNPAQFFETDRVLVNDLAESEKNYLFQFGDYLQGGDSQFVGDASIYFGAYDGYFLQGKKYPTPDVPEEYCFYYYIGAETWPDRATIWESQLRYLLRLIYRTKPCHLRCILRVRVVPDPVGDDYDIQDTTWDLNIINDSTTEPDGIQDSTT